MITGERLSNGRGTVKPGADEFLRYVLDLYSSVRNAFLRTDKTRNFLRGSAGSLVLWVVSLGIRMFMGIVLTRLLGAQNYGIYAYATTWLAIFAIPTMLGFDHITLRYVAAYKETGQWTSLMGLVRFAFFAPLVPASLVLIISAWFVGFVTPLEHDLRMTLLVVLSTLPVVVLTQVRQSILRGLDRPVLAQLPENIIYPACLILGLLGLRFFAPWPLTAPLAAVANGAALLVAFCIGVAFLRHTMREHFRLVGSMADRGKWLEMIPALVVTALAYQLFSRGDLLVLGAFRSAQDVGIYAVASRSAEQLMMLVYTAASLAGPSLFSSIYASGDIKELQRFTTLVTRSIFWLSLPLYVALIIAAPYFLSLFGPEFVRGTQVMRLLTTTFFVGSFSGFVIIMLYNTGHQRCVAVGMAFMALFNIGLSFILVPRFGATGAAISSGTSLILLHAILVRELYIRVGIVSLPFSFDAAKRASTGRSLP